MLEGDSPYYVTELTSIPTSTEDVATLTERFLVNWEGNSGDKVLERQNKAKQIHAFLTITSLEEVGVSVFLNFLAEYQSKVDHPLHRLPWLHNKKATQLVNTWYAYNRLAELGTITDFIRNYGYLGNGQDWVTNLVAKDGDIVRLQRKEPLYQF